MLQSRILFLIFEELFRIGFSNSNIGNRKPGSDRSAAFDDVPVSEGSDNETLGTTKELILVHEVHVRDGDHTFVLVLYVVETRLLQPFKVCRCLHMHTTLKTSQSQ